MKAILNLFSNYGSWFHEFFNFRSPCRLPFATKPLAHHLLDFCSNLQVEEVLLLDYRFDDSLEKEFNSSYQWYSKVKYMGSKTISNVKKLLIFHHDYCENDDILILNGLFFVGGASNQTEDDWKQNVKQIMDNLEPVEAQPTAPGLYFYHNQELFRVRIPQEKPLNSIQDYFNLNLWLLDNDQYCSLPGYQSQDGIIFGITPIIKQRCKFIVNDDNAPSSHPRQHILIGDNVRIEHDCTLKGPVIVGNNVLLDKSVRLERAIVLDNTYISNDLEFVDKIIDLNVIIDPIANKRYVMEENALTGDSRIRIKKFLVGCIHNIFDYLMAILLAFHLFFCYFIFLCFFFAWTDRSRRWYFKFSLDKMPNVLKTLICQKQLVGCSYPPAHCAVFTYSESIQSTPDPKQWQLDDQYFLSHDTIMFRLSIIMTILITRLFQNDENRLDN